MPSAPALAHAASAKLEPCWGAQTRCWHYAWRNLQPGVQGMGAGASRGVPLPQTSNTLKRAPGQPSSPFPSQAQPPDAPSAQITAYFVEILSGVYLVAQACIVMFLAINVRA